MPVTDLSIVVVIGVVLISALLAMVRGFTREVLSIASWVAAAASGLVFTRSSCRSRSTISQATTIAVVVADRRRSSSSR